VLLPHLSPGIVQLAFGDEFAAAAPVLNVLGVSGGLVFFSLASSATNVALGVVRHGYWVGALAVAVNLSIAAPLAFRDGAIGAAWGTLAAEVAMLLVSQYFTSTALQGVIRKGRWAGIALLSAALYGWLAVAPLSLAPRIACGVLA
jgi:O-antigen/teichoic acid export membrane protein